MYIGVMNPVFQKQTLEEMCQILSERDVHSIEMGCGGSPGKHHCDPDILLNDEAAFETFQNTLKKYDMSICALSTHNNPVHPNREIAQTADEELTKAFRLAQKMGIDTIVTFSGCPGDCETSQKPNWVTCSWPDDYMDILNWQWNEKLIPYWKKKVEEAKSYGVTKIAFEMHPGFCVYNPYTLLKLREAVGPEIGANFDPSHLIWQGCDPVAAIRELGKHKAIYHFHAKDTKVDTYQTAVNGVLDTRHYSEGRSWQFRSVGCGHDLLYWRDIVAELRRAGYDKVLSIEHEDALMSMMEGLDTAIATLKQCVMTEPSLEMFWA
jgi:sugar phosphate isomerase/epimerase